MTQSGRSMSLALAAALLAAGALLGPLAPASASAGYALHFDGTQQYAWVPDSPSLDMAGSPFTVEAWVKPDDLSTVPSGWNPRVVEKLLAADPWAYDAQYWLYYGYGGSLVGGFYGPTGYQDCFGGALVAGEWFHVAVSSTSDTIRVYINGILSGSTAAVGSPLSGPGGGPLRVGWYRAWYDYFDGTIDELRVWNTARTQAEIQAAMFAPLHGDEAGLAGYWRFDEGAGQQIYDSSPCGNTGVLGVDGLPDAADPIWVVSDAPIRELGAIEPGYDTAQHRRFWQSAVILADYAHRLFEWVERITGSGAAGLSQRDLRDAEAQQVLAAAGAASASGWYSWVLGKVLDLAGSLSKSWDKTAIALRAVMKTADLARFYLTVDRLFDSFFTMRGESDEGACALRNAEGYLNLLPRASVENYLACADIDLTYEEWRAMDAVQRFSLLAQCEAFQVDWVYGSAAAELLEAGFPVAGYPSP
jgi:hypothetical protein